MAVTSYLSLRSRAIGSNPSIVGGRQHELLHVTSPDTNVATVEDGQHHSSVEEFGKWLVEVVCGAIITMSVSRISHKEARLKKKR